MAVKDQEKGDTPLFLELMHELHLMGMDILQGKGVHRTFLGVKTHRNALYRADIVHGTLLFEKGQGDLAALLIHFDRGNGGGDLLDQRQPGLGIFFIGAVDHILQSRSTKPSGIPCCHCS